MRLIAGALLILAAGIQVLLGGSFVLSSRYEAFKAEIKAEDLSAVSGDLGLSQEELAKMHKQAERRTGSAGTLSLVLGLVLLVLALAQIVAAVLVFLGRGRIFAVMLAAAAAVAVGLALAREGFFASGLVNLLVLFAALAVVLLSRPRQRAAA